MKNLALGTVKNCHIEIIFEYGRPLNWYYQPLINGYYSVGKIAEKAVCKSAFLTALYFERRINKNAFFQTAFLAIFPTEKRNLLILRSLW